MICKTLTHTRMGLPVFGYEFGKPDFPRVLILGGVHGDEIEGVAAAMGLLSHFLDHGYSYDLNILLVPQFNIDGILLKTRGNSEKIDLNRNLPTKDWTAHIENPRYYPGKSAASEPENIYLVEELKNKNLKLIISLHSWNPMINQNGACGPEAEVLSKMTGYKIEPDIGYPTPGSLGTYASNELKIPTITYEIERGLPLGQVVQNHVPALLAALKTSEQRFSQKLT